MTTLDADRARLGKIRDELTALKCKEQRLYVERRAIFVRLLEAGDSRAAVGRLAGVGTMAVKIAVEKGDDA